MRKKFIVGFVGCCVAFSGCAARRNGYRACSIGAYTGAVICGVPKPRADAKKEAVAAAAYSTAWVERNKDGEKRLVWREPK